MTEKEVNFVIYLLFLYQHVYNGVSFSDLICIFTMSYQSFACLFLQH